MGFCVPAPVFEQHTLQGLPYFRLLGPVFDHLPSSVPRGIGPATGSYSMISTRRCSWCTSLTPR
jgi:hypothetical protein